MMMVASFFAMFVPNLLIVYLANTFFPNLVVLGTLAFTPVWGLFHSVIMITLIGTLAMPFFTLYEIKRGKTLTPMDWTIGYFLVNAATIWTVTRFSEQFGLGVHAWWVVLILAAVMDFTQGVIMMQLGKLSSKIS